MHSKISIALNNWYSQHKRDLPWRKTKDPYKIWLSEVMLQQTVVKVVIPYFEKFIHKFPDLKKLAQASEEEVLSLWSGLGYYSRARNLHKGAQQILMLNKFPQTYSELLKIKGIGPYTASAISSIAYEEKVPVVDGNVIRVVTRIFDIKEDVQKKQTQLEIYKQAALLIQNQIPSEHNQAMMELGALVCTAQKPLCAICPVATSCKALKRNTVDQRPVKQKKVKWEPWLWEVYVCNKNNKWGLIQNFQNVPWLKGMWLFPGKCKKLSTQPKTGFHIKHLITKHQIYVKIKYKNSFPSEFKNIKWFNKAEIKKLGTSSLTYKILEKVD